jgi:hypothetical protein
MPKPTSRPTSRPKSRSSQASIGTLSLYDAQVTPQTLAREVVLWFQEQQDLPGVLVMEGEKIVGVFSRQQFFEQGCLVAGPLGWEQPIENLMLQNPEPALVVSDGTEILRVAAQIRLRSTRGAFDPIGVTFRDGSVRLVDAREVLMAQSAILVSEEHNLLEQDQTLQRCQQELARQQIALEDAQQMVTVRNLTLQNQQRHLERQQYEIFTRTEECQKLRHRLMALQTLLASQARELFQTCLESVSAIAGETDHLMSSDINLAKELEVVSTLSDLVKQVGQKALHLQLHSSIAASKSNHPENLTAFTPVTEDMRRLILMTGDAEQRVGGSIRHIKSSIADLARIAQTIARSTQGLIQQISAIDDLLVDLENLTDPNLAHEALLTPAQKKGIQVVRSRMRKIEQAGSELSTLYDSKKSYDLRTMLRSLEQNLQRSGK